MRSEQCKRTNVYLQKMTKQMTNNITAEHLNISLICFVHITDA